MDLVARRGRGRRLADPVALALRVVGAGCLLASGAVHLGLYLGSYGHIPTIGPLFLAQAITAFGLGAAALATGEALVALSGALLALATLGGYVLSLLVPLFGFREVRTGSGIAAAVVEVVAAGTLVTAAARSAGLVSSLARRAGAAAAGAAALAVSLALAFTTLPAAGPGSVTGTVVRAARLGRYGTVLVSSKGMALYLLSSETDGRIVCTGACLSIWPPLLVGSGGRPAASGAVAGHLGVVRRPDGSRQVTYNGYPLYLYAGDARPGQVTGQAITSFGGTWYLLRASASAAGATAVR